MNSDEKDLALEQKYSQLEKQWNAFQSKISARLAAIEQKSSSPSGNIVISGQGAIVCNTPVDLSALVYQKKVENLEVKGIPEQNLEVNKSLEVLTEKITNQKVELNTLRNLHTSDKKEIETLKSQLITEENRTKNAMIVKERYKQEKEQLKQENEALKKTLANLQIFSDEQKDYANVYHEAIIDFATQNQSPLDSYQNLKNSSHPLLIANGNAPLTTGQCVNDVHHIEELYLSKTIMKELGALHSHSLGVIVTPGQHGFLHYVIEKANLRTSDNYTTLTRWQQYIDEINGYIAKYLPKMPKLVLK